VLNSRFGGSRGGGEEDLYTVEALEKKSGKTLSNTLGIRDESTRLKEKIASAHPGGTTEESFVGIKKTTVNKNG